MFFLGPMLGLLGAGAGAVAGSAMVGGTIATLAGAAMGVGVGLGIAEAIQQNEAYKESGRMREAAFEKSRNDGVRKQAALTAAARKVNDRSLFRPNGDFAGLFSDDGDSSVPVFGV